MRIFEKNNGFIDFNICGNYGYKRVNDMIFLHVHMYKGTILNSVGAKNTCKNYLLIYFVHLL